MKVIVKFHHVARESLATWQKNLSREPGGNPALATFICDELVRELERHDGVPPGAYLDRDLAPPRWVWRFSADTWIQYLHHPVGHGFWRQATREVIILEISPRPPV